MKRTALILLCLTGSVGAFYLARNTADGPLLDIAAESDAAGPDASDDPYAGSELIADEGEDQSSGDLPMDLDPSERIAIAGAEAPDVRPLELQVWAGRQGVPAAGAEVFFVEFAGRNGPGGPRGPGRGFGRGRRGPNDSHWSEVAVREGTKFKANAAGRVTLPGVEQWAMVTARRPGEYGFTTVRRRHKDVETVTLGVDETLRVQVVDAAGKGVAGVPVGVHQLIPQRPRDGRRNAQARMEMLRQVAANDPRREEFRRRIQEELTRLAARGQSVGEAIRQAPRVDLRVRRTTDARGHAVVEHFQLYRRAPEKWWGPQDADRFQAALLLAALEPVAQPFVGRPVPESVLELRMPDTGSVVVRLVDHEGRGFAHPANAELRVQGAGLPEWTRLPARKEQDAGLIEFPFVGLGLEIQPHVWLDDRDFRWDGPVVAGPDRAGERVTIDVVAPPRFGMLRGRVTDAVGQPLSSVRTTFLVNGKAGRLEGEDHSLDPSGHFQLMFDVGKHQPPYTLEIRQSGVQPPVGTVIPLPALANGQTIDLGEIKIAAFACIARGVVRDDRQQPIAGASVRLQREREIAGKNGQNPSSTWRDEAFVAARTDAEGYFELFGAPPPGRYRLQVQATDHFPTQSDDIVLGGEVDVSLIRAANLVGTILMPEWLPAKSVQLRLSSATVPGSVRNDRVRDHENKKYIYINWVRPGLYSLDVLIRGFPDPVLRVDGLRVEAGQKSMHPRLQDLNLASFVFRYQITAVDEAGQAVTPAGPLLARVVRQDGKSEFVGFPWNGGKLELFSASPQMEVVQLGFGFRATNNVIGEGVSQLVFEQLPPVRLRMIGLRGLIGPELRVRVSMVLTGETGLPTSLRVQDQRSGSQRSYRRAELSKSSGAWLGAGDEVSVPLMREGDYEVVARLRAEGVAEVPLVLGVVKVQFIAGVQPVAVVAVDPAKVRAGLAEVQRLREQREAQQKLGQPGKQRGNRGR